MTKAHAARKLLELGPLMFDDFKEITGWDYKTCRWVLSYLVDRCGVVWRGGEMYGLNSESC
jgi:hypothetical protein